MSMDDPENITSFIHRLPIPVSRFIFGAGMISGKNAPGKPREGMIIRQATTTYGPSATYTGVGSGHKTNDDAAIQGFQGAVVLDGVSTAKGDISSRVAARLFNKLLNDLARRVPDLRQGFIEAHHLILTEAPGSATVGVGYVIDWVQQQARSKIFNCGDCFVVVGRHGKTIFRTKDHNMAQDRADRGEIPNTTIMRSVDPSSAVVTQFLGGNILPHIDEYHVFLEIGDYLIAGSDGLENFTSEELLQLAMISKTPEEAVENILQEAEIRMGRLRQAKDILRREESSTEGEFRDDVEVETPEGRKTFTQVALLSDFPDHMIDRHGTFYNLRGNIVGHYKEDNVTIHVYFHRPLPSQDRKVDPTATVIESDVPTQIGGDYPLDPPRPDNGWISSNVPPTITPRTLPGSHLPQPTIRKMMGSHIQAMMGIQHYPYTRIERIFGGLFPRLLMAKPIDWSGIAIVGSHILFSKKGKQNWLHLSRKVHQGILRRDHFDILPHTIDAQHLMISHVSDDIFEIETVEPNALPFAINNGTKPPWPSANRGYIHEGEIIRLPYSADHLIEIGFAGYRDL
ncbi:MAG: hypothetical protein HY540_02955 [Deltaproteobacteria bacterium]|nr:hypothetical protein [Deltaproteobacteria bacterium]